uniref:Uncharacterized protein n=1 Tax=Coturnix japonica TaxID=93934 RepID=A0A8C2U615_COTJA
ICFPLSSLSSAGTGWSDKAASHSPQGKGALNYGGVYVGLPSDAAAVVSSQTKAASKGIERSCIAFLLLSWLSCN